MPFSHVHTTNGVNTPEKQYAGCAFQNTTRRGKFGDALAEADWLIGRVMDALRKAGVENNTLVLFSRCVRRRSCLLTHARARCSHRS